MGYDKHQVAQEFTRWSESYDRSILQWLLFGPSHRVLIRRIREAAGDRPIKMLDVGCGTGVVCIQGPRLPCRGSRSAASIWCPTCSPRASHAGGCIAGTSCRCRETASVCRSPRDHSTSSPAPTASTIIRARIARSPRCGACLRPGGRLMIIDGYRDGLWGWFIYDVCVAGVEGDVHHASAQRFRELMTQAGLQGHRPARFPRPRSVPDHRSDRRGTRPGRSRTPFSATLSAAAEQHPLE